MKNFLENSILNIPAVDSNTIYQMESLTTKHQSSPELLMKNASESLFDLIQNLQHPDDQIVILSGKGNNGGDSLALASILKKNSINPIVITTHTFKELSNLSQLQYENAHSNQVSIYRYANLPVEEVSQIFQSASLIVDGLLGSGGSGNPKEPIASLIRLANESKKPILSIDIPSGLSPNKGKPSNPTIKATYTLTLGLPKKGLYKPSAKKFVGDLYLSDLDIPQLVFDKLNINYKSSHNHLIKLTL